MCLPQPISACHWLQSCKECSTPFRGWPDRSSSKYCVPLPARLVQSTPPHRHGGVVAELDHPGEEGVVLKAVAKDSRSVADKPVHRPVW